MNYGLDGKVVIVSGAGSGIGRKAALQFATMGAKVAIWDINRETAEETSVQIGRKDATLTVVADISDEHGVGAGFDKVIKRWGQIDVLCNNAGVMDRVQRAADVTLATWERVMRVNATGTFLMTRAVLPHMLSRKRGAIVNTASAAGTRGGAAGVAYSAAKHAVVGITRNVATMYRDDGIRCNAVCPGATNTNIASTADGPFDQSGWASLNGTLASLGSMREPDEIASAIVFLASDAASYVNGAILAVDGGWTAG